MDKAHTTTREQFNINECRFLDPLTVHDGIVVALERINALATVLAQGCTNELNDGIKYQVAETIAFLAADAAFLLDQKGGL